ncbi:LysE family translocator [Saccharibacillus alkalitolerans]|uniref:LysE family translocator n=1 Tax=Saccharibacillus alkalitolerans TaxID=2705290 RepID=A0ABX0F2J7_9BACL|nr:LysE family translocator [Saccharibacillus alkalitolerans]NGZ75218.1 LysE family translocator [Saccharibacillus alkalitolerans]
MEHFGLFAFMSFLLILLPGPDTGLATQNTMIYGRKGGVQTVLGSAVGTLAHTFAAVLGLSALIVKSALLFSVFKYAGALYLIYLGITSLIALRRNKGNPAADPDNRHRNRSPLLQGMLTNMLNPKVAVFFLTFLPQFLAAGAEPLVPFLLMGLTYTVMTVVWMFFYVCLLDRIGAWLKRPSVRGAMQGVTGFVLLGFGVKLALERRP